MPTTASGPNRTSACRALVRCRLADPWHCKGILPGVPSRRADGHAGEEVRPADGMLFGFCGDKAEMGEKQFRATIGRDKVDDNPRGPGWHCVVTELPLGDLDPARRV